MPRWHKVAALARKEISDMIRDRRSVFMAIVFPLILYPLLIIGLIQGTVVEESRAQKAQPLVAVNGRGHAKELAKALYADKHIRVTEFDGTQLPEGAVLGVIIPKGFDDAVARGETAAVKILYDSADQASLSSLDKVSDVIDSYGRDVLAERLFSKGLPASFVNPVKSDQVDTATPRKRGVFKLGKILAFLLVTFCMMGALYPALDTVAGEKERGTLETLLSIPATRLEILSGKYVAVFAMSVASVVSNFVSLSVTMLMVNNLMRSAVRTDMAIDFRVPTDAIFYIVPALLPLAAFFSAVSLGIAAFARSTREGQYYLAPLYVAALPLTSVALVSSVNLTYLTAIVPITSISLFLKDGLLGTLSFGPTVVALATTCIYAALALKWAASVFGREEVLFGAPTLEGEARGVRGVPTPGRALMVWAVTLILFFYMGTPLAARWGIFSVQTSFVINAGFIVGPALILAVIERLRLREVFPLAMPNPRQAATLALFIPAAIALSIAANVIQRLVIKSDTLLGSPVLSQSGSFGVLAVSLALLPAICEELFYRGFLFKAFSARMAPVWAVILSALVFTTAHLNVFEVLPLLALGIVLALAMRATGTLLVPMAIHFANNFLFIYLAWYHPKMSFDWGFAASAAALAGSIIVGVGLTWAGVRVAGARRG